MGTWKNYRRSNLFCKHKEFYIFLHYCINSGVKTHLRLVCLFSYFFNDKLIKSKRNSDFLRCLAMVFLFTARESRNGAIVAFLTNIAFSVVGGLLLLLLLLSLHNLCR